MTTTKISEEEKKRVDILLKKYEATNKIDKILEKKLKLQREKRTTKLILTKLFSNK